MIEKIITFIEIIILIVYGLYNYIKNYVIDIIHRNKHEDPPTLKSDNVTETFEDHSQNQQEELNENIESKTSFNIYRPNDFYSYNINDYNDYSISKNQPDNLVLPKNYAFQTQEFELAIWDIIMIIKILITLMEPESICILHGKQIL